MKSFLEQKQKILLRLLEVGMGKDRLVGLEIGEASIKLAVLRKQMGRLILEACCREHLKDVEGGDRSVSDAKIVLKNLVKKYNLKGCPVVSVIPFTRYDTRLIILPKMPGKDLEGAIYFEAKKFARIPLESAFIDHVKIDEFEQEGVRHESHLVIVADRLDIHRSVELVEQSDLKLVGFTVPPLALGNIIARLPEAKSGDIVIALDMIGSQMNFSLLKSGKLRFTREIPVGSNSLRDSIRTIVIPGKTQVKLEEGRAEDIIRAFGIIEDAQDTEKTTEGIPLGNIAIMQRPVLEKILIEIQRSIDFCEEQFGFASPERLLICGEGVQLKNFDHFLATRLHIEAKIFDPAEALGIDTKRFRTGNEIEEMGIVMALGCAIGLTKHRTCFIPRECARGSNRGVGLALNVAAIFSIITAGTLFIMDRASEKRIKLVVNEKISTLENLKKFQEEHRAEAESVRLRRFKREMLLSLLGPDMPWGDILKDLSNRLNEDVELSRFELVIVEPKEQEGFLDYRVEFEGLLSMREERLEVTISRMLTSLAESPYFEDVKLKDMRALKAGVAKVRFNCRVLS